MEPSYPAQGQVNYALQIDYPIASTLEPLTSTKIVKSAPSSIVINSGIPMPGVLKKIGTVEHAPHADDRFYKCLQHQHVNL